MLRDLVGLAFAVIMMLALMLIVGTVRDARPAEPKLGWRLELCGGTPYDCRVLSEPLPNMICIAMADSVQRSNVMTDVQTHCRPVLVNEQMD